LSSATEDRRYSVCAYEVFSATPPTGKSTITDYVYVMNFETDKTRNLTKILNVGWVIMELDWA
jgi:hypothetical protein